MARFADDGPEAERAAGFPRLVRAFGLKSSENAPFIVFHIVVCFATYPYNSPHHAGRFAPLGLSRLKRIGRRGRAARKRAHADGREVAPAQLPLWCGA